MSKTVLIVDDVAFVRKTLSDIFTRMGFTVIGEAANAKDAIARYREHKPDLITMDIVMPGKSGIDATREIMTADKEARILVISAMEQESLIMDSINAGARDYIVKPFKESEIIKTVKKIFEELDNRQQT